MKNNLISQLFIDKNDALQMEYLVQFKTLVQSLISKSFWDSPYFGVIVGGGITFTATMLHEKYKERREAKKQRESKLEEMKIELSMLTAYLDNYATERYTYFNSLVHLLGGATQRSTADEVSFSNEENRYFLKTSDERSYRFAESITTTKAKLEVLQGNYHFYANDELEKLILTPLTDTLALILDYEKQSVANGSLSIQYTLALEKIKVIQNNIKLLNPL